MATRTAPGVYELCYVIDPHTTITYVVEYNPEHRRECGWWVSYSISSTVHPNEPHPQHWEFPWDTKRDALRMIAKEQENGEFRYDPKLGWTYHADIMNDLIEVAYQSPTGLYTHEIKKELRNSKAERMGVWLSELDYSLWEFFGRPVEDYDDWPPEERAKYWPGYIRVTDPEDNEEVLYLVNCHLIIEIFDRHNCTPDVENPERWQKIRGVG